MSTAAVAAPAMRRIRDYEVWGRLGGGGMSDVWLARHGVLCVPVIIKTLARHFANDAAIDRVLNEARLMARISDPRVVRALDAGVADGLPYLVQEYVDGIDIEELDRRRREALGVGLPLWFICEVMSQTCRALHAAHQNGIVHQDVKPSNVFGCPATGIRLGDFGIAVSGAARPREVSGTLSYMAPEQLRGADIDRATDCYGAGATAFVLRYGCMPFHSVDQVLDPNRSLETPPAQHLAEGYFQQLLKVMMSKDPAARIACLSTCAKHFSTIKRALRPAGVGSVEAIDRRQLRVGRCVVSFEVGDIAACEVDAIVCSSYESMHMRSGVGDALRRRGGDSIEEEALRAGPRALGECLATGAGELEARHVLHAVSAWNEASCVGRTTQRAFLLADELRARTLALPALGTGAARISLEVCASAMMTALRWHTALGGTGLERVRIVFDDPQKMAAYRTVAENALRADDEVPLIHDLGMPVLEGQSVRGDSLTQIDAAGRSGVTVR